MAGPSSHIEDVSDQVGDEGNDRPGSAQGTDLFDSEPEELTLAQRIEIAQAENHRLEQERELARLEACNYALRNSASSSTVSGAPAATPIASPVPTMRQKTLRPEKMRPYKGLSEGEHLR